MAVISVLGKIPRRYRRFAGKVYANAAYRQRHRIESYRSKYLKHTPHPAVLDWVVRQADGVLDGKK